MALSKPYADIPGTTVFDADMARKGYHLNQFLLDSGRRRLGHPEFFHGISIVCKL